MAARFRLVNYYNFPRFNDFWDYIVGLYPSFVTQGGTPLVLLVGLYTYSV
jgi:hypothetical protein